MLQLKYMGSKRRIAHDIAVYINNCGLLLGCEDYYEPFCGGGSVGMVVNIKNKHLSDINKYVIALLTFIRDGGFENYKPEQITEEHWRDVKANQNTGKYPDWYVCYVGIYCSYRGRWFESFFREHLDSTSGAVRNHLDSYENMKSEITMLQGIELTNMEYDKVKIKPHSVVYCDAPYINTKKYVSGAFDYDKYYAWLREVAKENFVVISEYYMPPGFTCVAEFKLNGGIGSGNTEEDYNPIERLCIVDGGWGTELVNSDEEEELDI